MLNKYFKIISLCSLLFISGYSYAEDQVVKQNEDWTVQLDNALKNKKYRTAAILASSQNSAALIGRLKPWAESNDTVSQWLYAKALYDEKRYEDSAKWTFIAFFFTRYDASLCTNIYALNLEKSIVDNYPEVVEKSRSDRETINYAVSETIDYLKAVKLDNLTTRSPVWICELTDKLSGRELTLPSKDWRNIYESRLNQFIKTTTGKTEDQDSTDNNSNSSFSIGQ